MKFLAISLLAAVCGFMTTGCATVRKVDDVLVWTKEKLATVDSTIATVKEKYDAKIAQIEEKQAKDVAELEGKLGHALDADGNGKVDLEEAKQAYVDLAKGAITDPAKRDVLMDPNTLLTILMALLGVGGGAAGMGVMNRNGTKKTAELVKQAAEEAVKASNGTS